MKLQTRTILQSRPILSLFILGVVIAVSGCLTAEHKEVRLTLNADGKSGTGKMTFTNIVSEPDDSSKDNSKDDFNNALITEYYQGRKMEESNKGMRNVKKRLYLDGDDLMGEVTFEFDDITKLGFFRYKGEGPYMYYTISDGYFTSGQFEATNGTYGDEKTMPVIFWDATARDFYFKVALSTPNVVHHSLAKFYKDWAKKQ
ncbi:MAG: hypothetical protein Q8916_02750 [Bacteroidota bacterium]|nr:hypothetical protein [Bacteroidota bacterium]MDP4229307.1 hypothetical protein [Bacteroidota bacterium]MDP4234868.1 hypothetical protein [Bacteroidota bacterium]